MTAADLERANAEWGANCGPASLAAICGLTLGDVHSFFPGFKGWCNPSMMHTAISRARRRYRYRTEGDAHGRITWPRYGLALIQFEGPWTEPNPARERWLKIDRAKRSHWVGVSRLQLMTWSAGEPPDTVCIWDCNAVDHRADGWCLAGYWTSVIAPSLAASYKRASGGWHITHAIEVERP